MKLKGIQYTIEAFKKLLKKFPDALLILANAYGAYKGEIMHKLKSIPEENYRIIPFEKDLFSLYRLFDVFVHVPINKNIEAFGQTYVEALASGVPSVFTLSGIAREFVRHKQNAMVVPFRDSESIYCAITEILQNVAIRENIVKNGFVSVNRFSLDNMIEKLERLYLE